MKNVAHDSEPVIHIVGARQFQGELLANYIESELKFLCTIDTNFFEHDNILKSKGYGRLMLWDCHMLAPAEIWAQFKVFSGHGEPGHKIAVALINLKYDVKFGVDALAKGIKGLFYEDDSLKSLKKGVTSILNGELWFSRETMTKSLLMAQEYSRQGMLSTAADILTRREKEILSMVASGSTNTDLANSLNISPHTVKTHINNIYCKIKAPNRVQAVLWAIKHLM